MRHIENIERDHLYAKTEIDRLTRLIEAIENETDEKSLKVLTELRSNRNDIVEKLKEWGVA
jgi:hypothetical protein